MTKEQSEKLIFIAGRIEGLAYGVENENVCDALMKCSEDIDRILKEHNSQPTVAPSTVQNAIKCCKTCKHESLPPDVFPCDDCWYGNGNDDRVNYWEAKPNENT